MKLTNVGLLLFVPSLIGCVSLAPTPTQILATQALPTPPPTSIVSTPALQPPADCPHLPLGGFSEVWHNEQVWPRLGCAVAPAETFAGTEAYLTCLHSLWLRNKLIFVAIPYSRRGWSFVADESGLSPEAPLMLEPVRRSGLSFVATGRHAWLANQTPYRQDCGGRSQSGETAFEGQLQQFDHGWLLWNSHVCFVLFDDGSWTMF